VGSEENEWIGSAGKTRTIGSYGDADSSNSVKKWGWGTESFGVVWSGMRGLASFSSGLIPSP
jgi:hypothetical protein